MSIYLDYNASAPIHPEVLDRMIDVYRNHIGNADSRTHDFGDGARAIVEEARKQAASLLKVSPSEVFFTSGATESNNIAIQGLKEYAVSSGRRHFVTSSIEHKAVLETVKAMAGQGFAADFVNPDLSGRVDASEVLSRTRQDTVLVSIMHVNNETGIMQPVREIGESLAERRVLFHVDATQSCGKLVEEIRSLKYDMLSFSAHKLGGPQGVGVLVLRKKNYRRPPVKAISYGGQQEQGIRPGTVPVALIAGCGKACEISEKFYRENAVCVRKIKETVLSLIRESGIPYKVNGAQEYCVDSTLNVCFPGVSSEALMIATKKYCGISNGSACTSKSYSSSYVLEAMGIPKSDIESSIRISWGPDTDPELLKAEFLKLLSVAKGLS